MNLAKILPSAAGIYSAVKGALNMHTYQSKHDRQRAGDRWSIAQRILLTCIILCIVGITALVFTIARTYPGNTGPGQYSTPSPVILASPSPTSLPTLTPTPTSTSTPTPSPTATSTPSPTPTPTPPPGVLGYPLYSGNSQLSETALTFDDGPNPSYTAQILAILHQYGVKATFFVIGSQSATYPALVQEEYQQGNVVGNHTRTHPNLVNLTPAEIRTQLQSTSNQIQADTGVLPTIFRPPGGNFNSTVQSIAASLGLSTILWNVDPKDWSLPGTSAIIQNVLKSTHNGSIILMHDGGGNRSETVAALPTIITTLEQRGFQFVTIPQMIENLPPGGTGPAQISPDQIFLEESFSPRLTLPRSFIHISSMNADWRKGLLPAGLLNQSLMDF